jgi:hypothetical protein
MPSWSGLRLRADGEKSSCASTSTFLPIHDSTILVHSVAAKIDFDSMTKTEREAGFVTNVSRKPATASAL